MTRKEGEHAGPSGPGTVVLELGPGAGALVLTAPAELTGAEIDISLAGSDGRRTHSMVRPRHLAGGTHYAAVYPNLPPGQYTIWRGETVPITTVIITGGVVTTAHLNPGRP
jgi:hypothetical protein